jgi:type IV pilus assembly protein PilB
VQAAIELARQQGSTPESILLDQGAINHDQLSRAIAARHGLDHIDLGVFKVDMAAANLISSANAKRYDAVPISFVNERTVLVAMTDPANVLVRDDVALLTGYEVKVAVASREDIAALVTRLTRLDDVVASTSMEDVEATDGPAEIVDLRESADDAPVIKLVNQIIAQAVEQGTSDIHFQPDGKEMAVRFRIDGVLQTSTTVPRRMVAGVVSRIKIMSDLDIAERRIPQDGRMSVNSNNKKIDLRVATLPTVWGEKVVMRILDNSTAMLRLADLGFQQNNFDRWQQSFTKPYGMLLVTGPTGSGKSTTLYATLNLVSRPEVNVITVEDPVEYRIPGINQVQANPRAGLTFARALRSILRSDPDIVLLGEIRDHETAQIAIEAALTGHLVLSTLHTNDAPSAVNRLIEMGIEPFLVGSALDCVLAQRLARRLCSKCKEAYVPTPEMMVASRWPWQQDELPTLFRATGCSACSKTGYKGRLALHEVMPVDEEIERLAVARASADTIGSAARNGGMSTLREDGLSKVLQGLTSIEEIMRVVV